MATLNKVMLIGRLGNNPEKKITTSGKSVVSVSLASSSFYKDEMGNKQENTEWHRLVFWGNLADNLCQYTKKGSLLYVEGRLQTKEWTKDDVRRFTTEIVVSNMQFLDKKVEQVKGDKPKKVEQAKSSEQIKKARPVIKVELKKDEPKKNELKKNIQVKSAEQTPKIESIKKVELKKDESRENKQVKSAEQTPKVESIKKVELKKDESRENKQVKSAEQTPKVESIKKVELKKDESRENKQVKSAEQTPKVDSN